MTGEEIERLYAAGARGRTRGYTHRADVETGDVLFDKLLWKTWRTEFAVRNGKLMTLPKVRAGFDYGHDGNGRSAQIMTHIGDRSWRDFRRHRRRLGL